ncbi:MAG TPA: M14 family zinc carboxypeptidase [candidate division Zixibacteria bacterium]|nr:M14 family zinc carboxypeptidase [candidate division Zixibacteria bacterium]
MTKKLIYFFSLLVLFGSINAVAEEELYFRFLIKERKELSQITKLVSIENVRQDTVYAIGTNAMLDKLKSAGYDVELLPHPSSLASPEMSGDKRDITAWDVYPTYAAYVQMMNDFETNYPGICRTYSIGNTTQGRELLFVKISDNVDVEEAEPEVMYTSTMHGDETTGYVLMLRLIDSILTTYGTDAEVTDMVNGMEIWINPLANPDGTYRTGNNSVSGAIRYNANLIDLNRNFPDPQDGPHPDGAAWQAETMAMMNIATQHSWIISANFHGGAEVVNYPWDSWVERHADDAWYIDVCRQYAESCQAHAPAGYMNDLNDGITNGFDWYEVNGGRQDYMNFWRGCREVTIELSNTKLLAAGSLPAYWGYNRISFFEWFRQANYGIRGLVTDSATGLPVAATISVIGHDEDSSEVYTDPDVGDYYRMIEAGTFSLRYTADGYVTKTISGINVTDFNSTVVDVELAALTLAPNLDLASDNVGRVDPGDNVQFSITLVNNGGGNATNVSAVLSTSDPNISFNNNSSNYATITAIGGTGANLVQFDLNVDSNCPLYHQVDFDLYITADGGYSVNMPFGFIVGEPIEDFETSNFTEYNWIMSGNVPWIISASTIYEGAYAAASGNIGDNQSSTMEVTFDNMATGTVSFARRVSSESNYDFLRFYIDDVQQGLWSGNIPWAIVSYPVDSGGHTFKWSFTKDGTISSGLDGGFIDLIEFPLIINSGPTWICGDIDGNGQFQGIVDLNYLINRIFRGGPLPPIPQAADVNGSGGDANIIDLNYMVNYVFRGGPAPDCL